MVSLFFFYFCGVEWGGWRCCVSGGTPGQSSFPLLVPKHKPWALDGCLCLSVCPVVILISMSIQVESRNPRGVWKPQRLPWTLEVRVLVGPLELGCPNRFPEPGESLWFSCDHHAQNRIEDQKGSTGVCPGEMSPLPPGLWQRENEDPMNEPGAFSSLQVSFPGVSYSEP